MSVKSRYNPETVGTPLEPISCQEIIQRFKRLHQLRLERIQRLVKPKQQVFLELLPLLFHLNVPLLPGFNDDEEMPIGIAHYSPGTQVLKSAKNFSAHYSYKATRLEHCAIEAIFLMGSVSSIAFSKNSDMDIWLCYHPDLTVSQRYALQRKAESIEKWSATLGLEVHFFLIDSFQFLRGQSSPISADSSGRLQHYLLLEEFYRTAIYIAGKVPAWWLVPPFEEHNYTEYVQKLYAQRFVEEDIVLDFGGLADVPPEEFTSVTLWHLYKALSAPHKSILKLLLMECYASEYPHSDWLCRHLKQAIYEGIVDIDELDPYLMIYRKIEHYLKAQPTRLLFARQCFYLKIMGPPALNTSFGSHSSASAAQILRSEFMLRVAKQWLWPDTLIAELTDNRLWTISKANEEYLLILDQLQQSYRIIQGFTKAHTQGIRNNTDLELIRRKLRSCLSPKPGKVDMLSTQSNVRIQEDMFSLVEIRRAEGHSGWLLYAGKVRATDTVTSDPIIRTGSPFESLVWLVVNGAYHKRVLFLLEAETFISASPELLRICNRIQQVFLGIRLSMSHDLETYRTADVRLISLAVINLGEVNQRDDGNVVISQQPDALSYSSERQCLVRSINSVTFSKWGEISVSRYLGVDGLLDYFTDMLNTLERPLRPLQLQFVCYTPVRGNTILYRLNTLFAQICKVFSVVRRSEITRYYLAGGSSYYCIQFQDNVFSYWEIPTKAQLITTLGSPQLGFVNTVFDEYVVLKSVIPALYSHNERDKIQIFYLTYANNVNVYVIDEKGALYMRQHPLANTGQVVNSYSVFLDAVISHYFPNHPLTVAFYEVQQSVSKGVTCRQVTLKPLSPYQKLDIRVSATREQDKSIRYCVYCNEQAFSSLDYGKAVFTEAAAHIVRSRQGNQHYPIHISDVDVPLAILGITSPSHLQCVQLLQFKQKIEARLAAG